MKCYYYGEVINLSLKDKKMLKKFPVIKCKNRFWGLCKIYTISIPEKDIDATVKAFQENMSTALKKEWYISYTRKCNCCFSKKNFHFIGKGNLPYTSKMY